MESDPPPSSAPRKVRFAPKGPTTRKKSLPPKREVVGGDDDDDGEDEETNEALLRKVNDHLSRRRPRADKQSSVEVVFSQGVASYGAAKGSSKKKSNAKGTRDSAPNTSSEDILSLPPPAPPTPSVDFVAEDGAGSLEKQKKKAYKEPWDYQNTDYPITLPLRRPYSGDPEVLDEEEFGESRGVPEYDESSINGASDLGLMEEDGRAKMLFLQLPADLPFGPRAASKLSGHAASTGGLNLKDTAGGNATSSKGKERVDCSKEGGSSGRHMGKLLVYKSGAVKLKLGDIVYDVSPGSDCKCAQDLVAINAVDRECCVVGELSQRAVVTPDIDSLLQDPVIHL